MKNRTAKPWQLLAVLALVIIAVASVVVAVLALRTADKAITAERDLRATLIDRCTSAELQREDARVDLRARIEMLGKLIAADQDLMAVAPEKDVFRQRLDAYTTALHAAQQRLDGLGVPRDCEQIYTTPVAYLQPIAALG